MAQLHLCQKGLHTMKITTTAVVTTTTTHTMKMTTAAVVQKHCRRGETLES